MIRTITIQNFRCFPFLEIRDCKRLNLIVGENGTGKTALLEAIFFALGATTEIGIRYRQVRGMDGAFQGSSHRIEDAIWGNLFHENNYALPIKLELSGDGPEARKLEITRAKPEAQLDFSEISQIPEVSEPIILTWTDAHGFTHTVRPKVTPAGAQFPSTGEDLPNFFFFYANQTIGSAETAARFSEMSRARRLQLLNALSKEYPWIEELSIEVSGGGAAVFATVKGSDVKRALPMLSGGINRLATILIAIASRPRSVVLIDEFENGIYFRHQASVWKRLISFALECDCQLFVSTHSGEMISALGTALTKKEYEDVAIWRTDRAKNGKHIVSQFSGNDFRAGIETETEIR